MAHIGYWIRGAVCALSVLAASPASASDESDIRAVVDKWIADFNGDDLEAFVGACAANAPVVDGFPPYAWANCADWMRDYQANNSVIGATHGDLAIGDPIYSEVKADRAYVIYPATFTDTQETTSVVYRGSWTITFHKSDDRWLITGSASAWTENTL